MHSSGASHSVRAVRVMWLLYVSCLLQPVAIRGHDYGSESGSKESVAHGAKYDNLLNTSQAFRQADLAGGYDSAELTAGYGDGPDSLFNHHQLRCQACQYRNVYAMASLKSIKAHVLLKLGIEQVPNRTRYPEVPRQILDTFYNTQSYHPPDLDYIGDDPSTVPESEEDYDYYQITNKIYILPNQNVSSKERSIGDKMFLQFQLEQRDYTEDIQARMMVYVHGEDWWKKNVRGAAAAPLGEVAFVVGKTAKGGAEIGRFQGPIPKGDGRFIEFNVTDLMLQWFKEARDLQADQRTNKYVVLEKFNDLARRLVVHSPNGGPFTPYIEIEFRDAPKKRIKRNLSLNCDQNANETRCCRYPLTVDFEKFGWDWIIAPKRYEASYCAGECMLSFLPKYEHTHVMQLSTSAIPCCSPKKMKSIKLLYFDMSYNVIYSIIPNMVVEECSCS